MATATTGDHANSKSTNDRGAALVTQQRDMLGGTAAANGKGRTTVADTVVQKIAGRAAREVSGVYDFGGNAARAFSAIAERIPGGRASSGRGVTVEVGETQAAIDLQIVVEYGVPIGQLAQSIRRNVIGAVEQMTGLEVVELNITVEDLHLPDEDAENAESTRAQQLR